MNLNQILSIMKMIIYALFDFKQFLFQKMELLILLHKHIITKLLKKMIQKILFFFVHHKVLLYNKMDLGHKIYSNIELILMVIFVNTGIQRKQQSSKLDKNKKKQLKNLPKQQRVARQKQHTLVLKKWENV